MRSGDFHTLELKMTFRASLTQTNALVSLRILNEHVCVVAMQLHQALSCSSDLGVRLVPAYRYSTGHSIRDSHEAERMLSAALRSCSISRQTSRAATM